MPARFLILALTLAAPLTARAAEPMTPAAGTRAPRLVREPLRSGKEVRVAWSVADDKLGKEPAAERITRADAKYAPKKPSEVKLGCRIRGR